MGIVGADFPEGAGAVLVLLLVDVVRVPHKKLVPLRETMIDACIVRFLEQRTQNRDHAVRINQRVDIVEIGLEPEIEQELRRRANARRIDSVWNASISKLLPAICDRVGGVHAHGYATLS